MKIYRLFFAAFLGCLLLTSCPKPQVEIVVGEDDPTVLVGNCRAKEANFQGFGEGSGNRVSLGMASMISAEDLVDHKYIKGVRIHLSDKASGKVFIAEELGKDNLKEKSFTYNEAGWQYVLFDEPYKIVGGQDIYVGYIVSGTGNFLTAEASSSNQSTEYIYYNGNWDTVYRTTGGLTGYAVVQAICGGGDYDDEKEWGEKYALAVSATAPTVGAVNSTIEVRCVVTNKGTKPSKSMKVVAAVGDKKATQTISGAFGNGESKVIRLTLSTPATLFDGNIEVSFESDNAKAVTKIPFYAATKSYERRHLLVEHFTGQGCGNCPIYTPIYEKVAASMANPNTCITVSHHSGFYDDDMTIQGCKSIASAIECYSAPNIMIDRSPVTHAGGTELFWNPYWADKTQGLLDDLAKAPALATVNVVREYNAATRKLTLNISGETELSSVYVTALIKQNNIKATQANATSANYKHHNVVRGYITKWNGNKTTVTNEQFSTTLTYTVPQKVGNFNVVDDDVSVVVFVHGDINSVRKIVYAAEEVSLTGSGQGMPEYDNIDFNGIRMFSPNDRCFR